tara:strand:+ start:349 stop:474 length:126 start_codon:yes stop_codon:yes gene_type:complete
MPLVIYSVEIVASGNLGIKSDKGFYDYSRNKRAAIVAQQFL